MHFEFGPALLFCPADRPERFGKALERADAVILDLEDAVAPESKAVARGNLIDSDLDPDRVIVRVNPAQTAAFESDIATLAQTDYRTVMVAKSETPRVLAQIDQRFSLIALCETARGVRNAGRLAALPNVTALMWGAEDLIASLGGTSSRDAEGQYREIARFARSRVLLESRSRQKAAIDAVYFDIADLEGLAREAEDAAASGFSATACIHPSHASVIRTAYRPDEAQLAWARGVLEAVEGRGVFTYEGKMVDEPVLRQARLLINRATSSRGA